MENNKYDFSGWATRSNMLCSDGLTISKDAFKHNDGKVVPLVWNHCHNDPLNVLGNALLKHRDGDIYAYCSFNDTDSGEAAKRIVKHGDVISLSICANRLVKQGNCVMHGEIRELSLVLAGANPGARIDDVMMHHEDGDTLITTPDDENQIVLIDETSSMEHSEGKDDDKKPEKEETVEDVINSMTEKQRNVMYALIGELTEENNDETNNEEETEMKHNAFEKKEEMVMGQILKDDGTALTHSEMQEIFKDGKRLGSLKQSCIEHGIENIGTLFPYVEEDGRNVTQMPQFIMRDQGWVGKVMSRIHRTPFSRIKSMFADITADEARAKGYIKGKLKKEEVFTLLKRSTPPTTVYKKQKIDRDDVVDITDFNVIAWIKGEMRMMLDEELARAFLVGDGRLGDDDDKIKEDCIRPIWTDHELYTIKAVVEVPANATASEKAKKFIQTAVKARKNYKGSGNPDMFVSEDVLTDCLLMEDLNGRLIYESVEKLARVLRVNEIIPVPVMEGLKSEDGNELMGLVVNLKDYNVGADKGGEVNMFDDFDIDYNAYKYLIEARCSGALIKPYSAIAIECKVAAA